MNCHGCEKRNCDECYKREMHGIRIDLCQCYGECDCCDQDCEFCQQNRLDEMSDEINEYQKNQYEKKKWRELTQLHNLLKKNLNKDLNTPVPGEVVAKKTFKDYYYGDDNFKQRHKKHMSEKINCPKCFFMTARNNMTKHQRSRNCRNRLLEMERNINNVIFIQKTRNDCVAKNLVKKR